MFDERDINSAIATCADGFIYTMHDQAGWDVHKDQLADFAEDILSTPETITWSTEVVAVRGDRLCLTRFRAIRSHSGFGSEWLLVDEINAEDLATRTARFDNENLKAAHDCLNQSRHLPNPTGLRAMWSTGQPPAPPTLMQLLSSRW